MRFKGLEAVSKAGGQLNQVPTFESTYVNWGAQQRRKDKHVISYVFHENLTDGLS
jgi:hypothetical protein